MSAEEVIPDPIWQILFPRAAAKREELASGARLVHYTSAETATRIIRGNTMWMRNAVTMNDFSEVEHGLSCLAEAWRNAPGNEFGKVLDEIFDGLSEDVAKQFNALEQHLRTNTFLTCLSEHLPKEDQIGRLSMWRAYGGKSGVALVLNSTPFLAETDDLKAYSSPVAYLSKEQVGLELAHIAREVRRNRLIFESFGREYIMGAVVQMLMFAALCTKHPAFAEEREWRIIYQPTLELSKTIESSVEVINSIPQIVQKIPLKNSPEEGLFGAALPDLLHRIIIGPTADGMSVYQAFCKLLEEAGIDRPWERVSNANIPLRQP